MNNSKYGIHENNSSDADEEPESLTCYECYVNFTSQYYLNNHLLFHIKQPWVSLKRVQEPPIRITLKSISENSFEIISSPTYMLNSPKEEDKSGGLDNTEEEIMPELADRIKKEREEEVIKDDIQKHIDEEQTLDGMQLGGETPDYEDCPAVVTFSPNFVGENGSISNDSNSPPSEEDKNASSNDITIPGAEPTPPPEPPSPEFPKIRIKTGLLKVPLTITEITDDNPNGEPRPEMIDLNSGSENSDSAYGSTDENSIWATPSLEDPLRLPEANDSDGSLISSLFNNNNDRAKDLGFTTSESEFISLDRFDDRNRGALQVYSSASTSHSQNPLDTIAGLPMQQLAEQVSRLQPSNGSAMHQQNVLINIQQFQQPPPPPQQHTYQPPPPMYPHPPHPAVPPQPMYHQPYQYQPPNPMYYPPSHGYGAPMPPPHRPPMVQPQMPQPGGPQQMGQPMSSMAQPYSQAGPPRPQMATPNRQPMPPQQPRQPAPRQPMGPRQPMMPRQRAPMIRPRANMPMGTRGPRPRMSPPNNSQSGGQNQQGPRMMKRSPEQIQSLQAKRKRMDVLVPDKHDDADCEVIAVQPKNTGLPQIQSIQGNAPEPGDNSVMHLSDSITLSVRNPPPRPPSPKKSDAKAVANILATRGITVTAAPKSKKADSPPLKKADPPPVAINLNSAVSIVPAHKTNNTNSKNIPDSKLPTVDLTDDSVGDAPSPSQKHSPQKPTTPSQKVLPFQCDLCPAKYPNSISLSKHRQSFHKTGGLSEFGIPLIDLKQPGLVHRLTTFGIYNYIPLPGASADTTFALPIISATNRNVATNFSNMGVSSILTLGPIRSLPRPVQNNNPNNAK